MHDTRENVSGEYVTALIVVSFDQATDLVVGVDRSTWIESFSVE